MAADDDAAAARKTYGPLVDHFSFYASYHSNRVNQLIHKICVPLILVTAFAFLSYAYINLPGDGQARFFAGTGLEFTVAVLIAACYVVYYLFLNRGLLGVFASVLVIGCLYAGQYMKLGLGWTPGWVAALAIHIVSWIAQFVGHGKYEGRAPALLDNLFQALFLAPIFVTLELLMDAGALKSFHAAVMPLVEARITEHKKKDALKKGGAGATPAAAAQYTPLVGASSDSSA